MSSSPQARGIRLVLSIFRDHGWQDKAGAALSIVEAFINDSNVLSDAESLARVVPDQFILVHNISIDDVWEALTKIAEPLQSIAREARLVVAPPIIQMADIDSFAQVRYVSASDVASFANPLNLLEDIVEQIIAKIIGEPYRVKDWGGELDDMFTGQVILGGRNTRASFLLKGSGLKGPLKPKYLGHNGDQITRMMAQPAELYVVQHVNRVDPSVTKQLRDAILARRTEGNTAAVGTVWDGVDTARLGVAYGFLDASTGDLLPGMIDDAP